MLGAELPRHFMRTLRALDLHRPAFWLGVTGRLGASLSEYRSARHRFDILVPVLEYINAAFAARIGSLGAGELTRRFAAHDVWHCAVNMPAQAVCYAQVHEGGALLPVRAASNAAVIGRYHVATPTHWHGDGADRVGCTHKVRLHVFCGWRHHRLYPANALL